MRAVCALYAPPLAEIATLILFSYGAIGRTGKMLKVLAGLGVWALACLGSASASATPRFEVTLPATGGPTTGRLIVAIATKPAPEPRMSIHPNGPVILGTDVEGARAGAVAVVDDTAKIYPLENLRRLPAGEYYVQAVLVRYTEYKRSDGHTIWAPGNLQRTIYTMLPGNLHSGTQKIRIDPASNDIIRLKLDQVIPPTPEAADTPFIKRVTFQSPALTKFWGRPMFLRAHVLLPRGWSDRPKTRYPAVYLQSHSDTPFSFSPTPVSAQDTAGARAGEVEDGHEFYQSWVSDRFPRMVAIAFEQTSPFFLEAYSVNSANNGPWGDAITKEFIPYLEKRFRLIPESYARIVQGASTGGWEAMALQLYYPDMFGGAWVYNPDPISFTHYEPVNIYKDGNLYTKTLSPFLAAERISKRTSEGDVIWTQRQMGQIEAVLGSRGRSGYQLDAWQSVHGPVGPDGYPTPLFDKTTGAIDLKVAEYYREHGYDLTDFARRNWATLGPKLSGKLNMIAGDTDWFFLNLGVYDFEAMVRETAGPDYPIRFVYGRPNKGHNWHHTTYAGMIREMADHVRRRAPAGATTDDWAY